MSKKHEAMANYEPELPRWGNASGLSTLQQLVDFNRRVGHLENKVANLENERADSRNESANLKSEVEDNKVEIRGLKTEIQELNILTDSSLKARSRLISNFLMDKYPDAFDNDEKNNIS